MNDRRDDCVLVTGGAGYIASHVVLALAEAGIDCVVLDNLAAGRRGAVSAEVPFVVGDVADTALVHDILQRYRVTAVMHFAGSISVPESVMQPLEYYRNNVDASRALIASCARAGIDRFVFSSTAAVYGQPRRRDIAETATPQPLNPYGRSKLITEWVLRDVEQAHRMRHVILRYFNVAGADSKCRAGFASDESSHLIKVACETALGRRAALSIFGTDYPTRDGTCIRDFIHVSDLATAHVAALRHLDGGGASATLNCGYGRGFSVLEVVAAVEHVTGRKLPTAIAPRRPGDAAEVVSDARRIRQILNWKPRRDNIHTIIEDTLNWQTQRQQAPVARAPLDGGAPAPRQAPVSPRHRAPMTTSRPTAPALVASSIMGESGQAIPFEPMSGSLRARKA